MSDVMDDTATKPTTEHAVERHPQRARYEPQLIEPKWRERWEESGLYRTDLLAGGEPKFYNLVEFPYPSAEGLHIGHVYTYSGADVNGRFQRMRGHEVFEPMGFDAFGIHSENYALKQNINPMELTARTTRRYRAQLNRIGAMFDWSHSVDTSQPNYYKWTQWLFLQMYKAGLAVRKEAPVNWCPSCLTVLAEEQIEEGRCERCGTPVVPREMTQWFFRITAYADRLLDNLATLDWPEESRVRQANWIGRSEGARLTFRLETGDALEVFTTRPDTVWGATFMVLAPEHPLVPKITTPEQAAAVEAYVLQARGESEIERLSTDVTRPKTGVFTGAYAVNPVTNERIPVWIADYVLMGYGTGAIMAVPAHDERDFQFAHVFGLPIRVVIQPVGEPPLNPATMVQAYVGPGVMVNSGPLDGTPVPEDMPKVIAWLAEHGLGTPEVTYRLRDWLISRQRYWGPPIPIVYCERCGVVPVPEDQLPVLLPQVENFRPTGTGQSPLASVPSFVNTTCPTCGGPARRETDVSDTFLDSSWYFLRYPCTEWNDRPFDQLRVERWLPVDMYFGGKEHVVRHHLYARFVTMVLHDQGFLPFEEPFKRLRLHGFVTKQAAKMSKSKGNVINPDEYIDRYGADAFRTYLLFMGPYDQDNEFSDKNLVGVTRFLERVWRLVTGPAPAGGPGTDLGPMHRFIRRVTEDLERYQYHTAIAALMEYANWVGANRAAFAREQWTEALRTLTLLLAPFAPFLAEELWARLGGPYSVHQQRWPSYEEALTRATEIELPVQVDGKVRDRLTVPADLDEARARELALASPRVQEYLHGMIPSRVIYVPGRLINIVVR